MNKQKHWLLAFHLILYSNIGFAQMIENTITIDRRNTEYDCLYNDNDTIHIIGKKLDAYYGFKYLHSVYYPNDSMTHKVSFGDTNISYNRSINLLKVGEHFVSSTWSAKVDTYYRTIIVSDRLGNVIKNIEKNVPNTKGGVYYQHIYQNDDSSYSVKAHIDYRKLPYYRQLIFKLDKNYNIIDSIFTDQFNIFDRYDIDPGGMTPTQDGGYQVIHNTSKFDCALDKSIFNVHKVEIDKNLKIINTKSIKNRKIMIANSIYIDRNRTILYGQTVDTNVCIRADIQFSAGKPYIAMIDSNMDFIWEINFEKNQGPNFAYYLNYSLERVIKLKDGNFLAIGNYDYPVSGNLDPDKIYKGGLIIKFNLLGKILWSRKHQYSDYGNLCLESDFYLRDVTELSNGNLFAVGVTYLSCATRDLTRSPQRGWILRMDSLGRDIYAKDTIVKDTTKKDTSHVSIALGQTLDKSITIYPNPTQSKLTVDIENPLSDEIKIEIQDILGRILFEKTIAIDRNRKPIRQLIDLDNILSGVYTITVVQANKMNSYKFELLR